MTAGRLLVQYPGELPVRIDGTAAGTTNSVITLSPGRHRVEVGDRDATEPASQEVTIEPGRLAGLTFQPRGRPLDRFSALYCAYNGFQLGQFLALAFAAYAREDYLVRRARMQEFLDEIDAGVRLPEQPVDFGSDEYDRLVTHVLTAVAARSGRLADLAHLGLQMTFYGHLRAADDPVAAEIGAEVLRLARSQGLPEPVLDDLVPLAERESGPRVDDVLSPSLVYLGQVVERLEVEPDTAFVIMPFEPPYAGYFSTFYRPALESAGVRAFRAWGGLSNEDYCELLLRLIARCGLVWADVSDGNRNVFYEVGAAHALGKLSFLVVHEDQADNLPANVGHDAVMRYSPSSSDWPEETVRCLSLLVTALRLAAERGGTPRVRTSLLSETVDVIGEQLLGLVIPAEAREALQRGREQLAAGEPVAAEAEFTTAIELGLNDHHSYAWRGVARMQRADDEGAIDDLTESLTQEPDQPHLLRLRGVARSQVGDDGGADADLSAFLEREPNDAEAHSFRGIVRASLGRLHEAEADFAEAVGHGHDTFQLHEQRAYVQVRLGDLAAARASLDRARAMDPQAAAVAAREADLAIAEGRPAPALDAYSRAVQGDPSAHHRFGLALAMLVGGQVEQACAEYAAARRVATTAEVRAALADAVRWCPHPVLHQVASILGGDVVP